MELKFDPEKKFEEIMGRPINPEERERLTEFVTNYILLKNKANPNDGLRDVILSALEADRQDEFSVKDFKGLLQEYEGRRNSSIPIPRNTPKEVISSVRKACDKYHEHSDEEPLRKILLCSGFVRIDYGNSLIKKASDEYKLLILNNLSNNLEMKTKTGFISLPPSEGKKLEERIESQHGLEEKYNRGLREIIDDNFNTNEGLLESTVFLDFFTLMGYLIVAAAANVGSWGSFGITMGTATALPTTIVLGYREGVRLKAKLNLRKIEAYFSDKSPYRHMSSTEPYNPEVILNAIASNGKK